MPPVIFVWMERTWCISIVKTVRFHCNGITWASMRFNHRKLDYFCKILFVLTTMIKAQHHRPSMAFPSQRVNYAENVSMSWRRKVISKPNYWLCSLTLRISTFYASSVLKNDRKCNYMFMLLLLLLAVSDVQTNIVVSYVYKDEISTRRIH